MLHMIDVGYSKQIDKYNSPTQKSQNWVTSYNNNFTSTGCNEFALKFDCAYLEMLPSFDYKLLSL